MGCFVCDKNPIAVTISGYDLCSKHKKAGKKCKECNTFFIASWNKQVKSCPKCRENSTENNVGYTYQKVNYPERNCLFCDKEFKPKSKTHRYCSQECCYNYHKEQIPDYERERILIFDRDNYQCIYCGKTSYNDRTELHVDHIIPKSKNGSFYAENLVTSCVECNLGKSNMKLKNVEIILEEVKKRNKEANIHQKQLIKLK